MGPYPNLYLLVLVLAALVYYLRRDDLAYKKYVLILASAVVLWSVSFAVFVTALLAAGFAGFAGRRVDSDSKALYAGCVVICLLPVFVNDILDLSRHFEIYEFLGGGFLGIRTYLLFKSSAVRGVKYRFSSILVYILFFPLFLVGPIERPEEFEEKIRASRFDVSAVARGLLRLLAGLVKIYLLVALMSTLADSLDLESNFSLGSLWLFCIANWLLLYFSFSGFADVAIGSASIFGIRARENFNMPFLATTIQEYWQRWHITLMEVVSENVYRPFVRKTGRRAIGFYVSFFFMGMWHSVSLNFLLHGLIHATTFAVYFHYSRARWSKRMLRSRFFEKSWVKAGWTAISILVTISCVSLASTVGTTDLVDILWEILR